MYRILLLVTCVIVVGLLAVSFFFSSALFNLAILAFLLGIQQGMNADQVVLIPGLVRAHIHSEGDHTVSASAFLVGGLFTLGQGLIVTIGTIVLTLPTFRSSLPRVEHIGGWFGSIASILLLVSIGAFLLIDKYFVVWYPNMAHSATHFFAQRNSIRWLHFVVTWSLERKWTVIPLGILFACSFTAIGSIARLSFAATALAPESTFLAIIMLPLLWSTSQFLFSLSQAILINQAFTCVLPFSFFQHLLTLIICATTLFVAGVEMLSLIAATFRFTGGIWESVCIDTSILGQRLLFSFFGIVLSTVISVKIINWFLEKRSSAIRSDSLEDEDHWLVEEGNEDDFLTC